MIKKKTKERKTRVKKITRGGELNIGPFVPPNYGIMTVDELEQLKKSYIREKELATIISEKRASEYEKNQQLLSDKEAHDIITYKINENSSGKFWMRWYLYMRLLLTNIAKVIWFIASFIVRFFLAIWAVCKWIWRKIGSICHIIYITLIYLFSFIGNTVIGRLLVRFVEGVVYIVKYILDTFWGFCKWLGSTEIFSNLLFFKGPVPRIIWGAILIAAVLGILLGWAIPSTTDTTNSGVNDVKKYDGGILSENTEGSQETITNTGDAPPPVAEKTVYDCPANGEYFSSPEKVFTHLTNDPIDFTYKLIIYVQTKIIDSIFPPEFCRTCLASLRQVTDSIKRVTNQHTSADNYSIQREDMTLGRPDNIYNIDLSLIKSDAPLNTISDILTSEHNHVYSIARPKDIEWKMPSFNYKDADYSSLPDSIKNMIDPNTQLSLEDKKYLTIPWVKRGALYELSCDNIYYTNSCNIQLTNQFNPPDILKNKSDNRCAIVESRANKNTETKKRHFDYNSLNEYII